MDKKHAMLMKEMVSYDSGDLRRIQHMVKVYGFASTIGRLEGLSEDELYTLETAAILHDIGIKNSMKKYGSSMGKYQEEEGPPEAERLMRELGGFTEDQIEKVKFLVGHHHTYEGIRDLDYQILIEADFLVNLYENPEKYGDPAAVLEKHFRTETGKQMLKDSYLV